MPSTSIVHAVALTLATLFASSTAQRATACCDNSGSCNTVSGVTDGGLHWCYGFQNGNLPFGQNEANVARCLVDLHTRQPDVCITTEGSSCANTQSIVSLVAINSFDAGTTDPLDADASTAIQAAMQAAFVNGLTWSDDLSIGPGLLNFAYAAENGAGIRGVTVQTNAGC